MTNALLCFHKNKWLLVWFVVFNVIFSKKYMIPFVLFEKTRDYDLTGEVINTDKRAES